MDRIGGAFESLTGTGDNTNQSQSQSQSTVGNQTQQSGGSGILRSLGDKVSSVVGGAGGGGGNAKTEGEQEANQNVNENGQSATAGAVEGAKDEQIEEFIRHQYKSTPGDGSEKK